MNSYSSLHLLLADHLTGENLFMHIKGLLLRMTVSYRLQYYTAIHEYKDRHTDYGLGVYKC
jgi:hypothetical protein